MARPFRDLTGETFDRLGVICPVARNRDAATMWLCRCICGRMKNVRTTDLTSGHTRSCGCLQKEQLAERNRQRARNRTGI